jgi:hypothetical protein
MLGGKPSTTWAIPPALFAFSFFWVGSHVLGLVLAMNCYAPTCASLVAGNANMNHKYFACLLRWGLANFFLPGVALNCDPLNLCLPCS